MKRTQKTYRSQAGFSILELLLVLVILSILAGIVGVRFAGKSQDAKITAAESQIEAFSTAIDMYEQAMGAYPSTQQGLDVLIEEPAGSDDWDGPYLRVDEIPLDEWGNEWQYRYPGVENEYDYDLYSFGPDGREGGDDDVTNWTED